MKLTLCNERRQLPIVTRKLAQDFVVSIRVVVVVVVIIIIIFLVQLRQLFLTL